MLLSSRFPMLLQYRQFYSSMTSLQSDEADNTCTVIILIMSFLAINRHLLLLCYAYGTTRCIGLWPSFMTSSDAFRGDILGDKI